MKKILPVSSRTSIESQANRLPTFRTISDASAFIGALTFVKEVQGGRKMCDPHVNNFEGVSINGLTYVHVHWAGAWAPVLINDPKDG